MSSAGHARRHRGSGSVGREVVASLGASRGGFLGRFLRRRGDGRRGDWRRSARSAAVDAIAATGAESSASRRRAATPRTRFGPRRRRASQEEPRVGADVGAKALPRVGAGCGLARDAPPRRPQRAPVEGRGAVRFRCRRRRDRDTTRRGARTPRPVSPEGRRAPARAAALSMNRGPGAPEKSISARRPRRALRSSCPSPRPSAATSDPKPAQPKITTSLAIAVVVSRRACCHVFVLQSEHRHIDGPDVDAPVAVAEPVHALPQQTAPRTFDVVAMPKLSPTSDAVAQALEQAHDGAESKSP